MHNDSTPLLGWLLVGHGTRHERGLAEFAAVTRYLVQFTPVPVEACYLELAEPTIEQGLAQLAARGVKRVLVVPLLLFAAGHAKHDVPDAVLAGAKAHRLEIVGQAAALECQEHLMELSRRRVLEQLSTATLQSTTILFVGRGSGDRTALQKVVTYTQLLGESLKLPAETAYVAVAKPSLPEQLESLGARGLPVVVVLPHLLFAGEVLNTIREQVNAIAERYPATQWLLAQHLAVDEQGGQALIAQAILARIAETNVR